VPGSRIVDDGDFKTSSYTGVENCVEVALRPDEVLVRNSKRRDQKAMAFTHDEWRAFIAGAKDGEFDVP
jgi:hypothetical protein